MSEATTSVEFVDKEIECANPHCRVLFPFTAKGQAFFAEKGFKAPRYCRNCRNDKKANQNGNQNFSSKNNPMRERGDGDLGI